MVGTEAVSFETEDEIEAFAEMIFETHDGLAAGRGLYNPPLGPAGRSAVIGRLAAVVNDAFGVHFGCRPCDRFADIFEQAAFLS